MSSPDEEPGPSISARDNCVRVALRIRPQISREKVEGCRVCTSVTEGEPQVFLGNDRAFTYDHVFDKHTHQTQVYAACVKPLVEGTFNGYNATVLAYGQTGSGKTYSMGTGLGVNVSSDEVGIIPRAVQHIFDGIQSRIEQATAGGQPQPVFKVQVQFIELYNEEIIDLLDEEQRKGNARIHEDNNGSIYMTGVSSVTVSSTQQTMDVLRTGALCRSTASTNMNSESSRSHALFSIHIKQQKVTRINQGGVDREQGSSPDSGRYSDSGAESGLPDVQMLTAKFHFVDLAGSERLKRTGATGDRAKEGISINCGLLALGNVISALGDVSKKASHIPYRDSKLTRLLQDSLGGNSRTLMIACISPSDCDFVETLNTLKYANRAKNIKNKVIVNQDKTSRIITELRATICALQAELIEYKQGKRVVSSEGNEEINDQYHENVLLQNEVHQLRVRVKAMAETMQLLKCRNVQLLTDNQASVHTSRRKSVEDGDEIDDDPVSASIRKYLEEIEDLRTSVFESQSTCEQLRRQLSRQRQMTDNKMTDSILSSPLPNNFDMMTTSCMEPISVFVEGNTSTEVINAATNVVEEAKADIERLKEKARLARNNINSASSPNLEEHEEEDGMEDESSSDDEQTEQEELEEKEAAKVREDLADLQTEISIKQVLVDELQRSQVKLELIKQQYENKLKELMSRIQETESERDRVLMEMNSRDPEKMSIEKVERVKSEYEAKLGNLRSKLKQVQTCEREHQRMLQKQQADKSRLQKLTHELDDMKKAKVQLMQRMKEESKRAQLAETQRVKQVAQLHKEARKHQSVIKDLQNKESQREAILKRKQEELVALKKKEIAARQVVSKPRSQVSSAIDMIRNRSQFLRTPVRSRSDAKLTFSPKIARQRWNDLETNIGRVVTRKQTLTQMESELERLLEKREQLRVQMQEVGEKRRAAPANERAELSDQMEGVQANLEYVNEAIADCQKAIVQVDDEAKEGSSDANEEDKLAQLAAKCTNLSEAKYILEHLLSFSVSQSLLAAQKDAELKEKQARLRELETEHGLKEQLLTHVISGHPHLFGLSGPSTSQDSPSLISSLTASLNLQSPLSTPESPRKALSCSSPEPPRSMTNSTGTLSGSDKARRRTATTEELLYPLMNDSMSSSVNTLEAVPEGQRTRECSPNRELESSGRQQESSSKPAPPVPPRKNAPMLGTSAFTSSAQEDRFGFKRPLPVNHSAPSSFANLRSSYRNPSNGQIARQQQSYAQLPKTHSDTENNGSVSSSSFVRGVPFRSTVAGTPGWNRSDLSRNTQSQSSFADSPRSRRKQNVFQRLRPFSSSTDMLINEKGRITEYNQARPNVPLQCVRVAAGHSKAVLTVVASDRNMLTGSKDRTAKLWDLERGEEVFSSGLHPNSVNCVRMLPSQHMLFTASMGQIKLWDIRHKQCVKTLTSSGLTFDGESVSNTPGRQTVLPANESMINAIEIDSALKGTYLLSAAGNQVRLWDLRSFAAVGKLASATSQPKSEVSTLATAKTLRGEMAITGSRDHCVKTYLIPSAGCGGVIDAEARLDPPHYDGISCLATVSSSDVIGAPHDWLISGSRDQNLMKWDLKRGTRLHQEVKAHPTWILGLCTLPPPHQQILVSSCRDGLLRLWDAVSFDRVGSVQAHAQAVNALCANKTHLFSACNDGNIGIWKPKSARLLQVPETEC